MKDLAFSVKYMYATTKYLIPEAMYNVAKILLAKDFEKNKDEAIGWLRRSANAGYDAAYDMLSDMEE